MSKELAVTVDQEEFTVQQTAALVQLGVQDATPADLAIFFHQVKRTGLDPFARQIYMISRRQRHGDTWVTKQTIQTGIDGFRLIARRAADKRGEVFSMDDVLWADPNGGWHDLWIWDEPPAAAKVTIHVGEGRFSAVAATREYMPMRNGRPSGQWATMPAVMIAKCAEALALRKAFPLDLSGLYTDGEMDQADARQQFPVEPVAQSVGTDTPASEEPSEVVEAEIVEDTTPAPDAPITDEQSQQLIQLATQLGMDKKAGAEATAWATRGRTYKLGEMTQAEAAALIGKMVERLHERQETLV